MADYSYLKNPPLEKLLSQLVSFKTELERENQDRRLNPPPKSTISRDLFEMLEDGIGLLPAASKQQDKEDVDSVAPDDDYVDAGDQIDDEEYMDEIGLPEDDPMDLDTFDLQITLNGESMSALEWLRSLNSHNRSLMNASIPEACPHLRPGIIPQKHQMEALGYIEHNTKSKFKAICIADPPGLGKTLPAQMAIARSLAGAKRFSIVVVPSSVVSQWVSEFEVFFNDGAIDVYVLNDSTTPCTELLKHDVIITTYSFVMAQYRKYESYLNEIAKLRNAKSYTEHEIPKRPDISIFSEALFDTKEKCPYLVLDESHSIKNIASLTYFAVKELRELANGCIMLSSNPVDNTWEDLYAPATLLRAQPFHEKHIFLQMFTAPDPERKGQRLLPKANFMQRLHTFLMAWIVRRPANTISLPQLTQLLVNFDLTSGEEAASNTSFEEYQDAMHTKPAVRRTKAQQFLRGRRGGRKKDKGSKEKDGMQWAALFKALQHACHPSLVDIMAFVRNHAAVVKAGTGVGETFDDEIQKAKWEDWRNDMKTDEKWKSSRILALISEFNRQRDLNPDVKILVFSESVYFLDIIEIAFKMMDDPVEAMRFSGRDSLDDRTKIVERFTKESGPLVMLISQEAGGQSLNLTSASVVILCGPFWKLSTEQQAYGRAHRFGQKRPVTVIRLFANDCLVETHRAEVRDRKNNHNQLILSWLIRKILFQHLA